MNKTLKKIAVVSLVFVAGILVGYALTICSLFPTAHSNYIFAKAPDNMPYGNDSPAVSAHLSLIHDVSLLSEHTWKYQLTVCNAQGKIIAGAKFDIEQVGGRFSLAHDGNLEWDDDAWAVTATIGEFNYRCEIPKNNS
jgi:hypothetical protein